MGSIGVLSRNCIILCSRVLSLKDDNLMPNEYELDHLTLMEKHTRGEEVVATHREQKRTFRVLFLLVVQWR